MRDYCAKGIERQLDIACAPICLRCNSQRIRQCVPRLHRYHLPTGHVRIPVWKTLGGNPRRQRQRRWPFLPCRRGHLCRPPAFPKNGPTMALGCHNHSSVMAPPGFETVDSPRACSDREATRVWPGRPGSSVIGPSELLQVVSQLLETIAES